MTSLLRTSNDLKKVFKKKPGTRFSSNSIRSAQFLNQSMRFKWLAMLNSHPLFLIDQAKQKTQPLRILWLDSAQVRSRQDRFVAVNVWPNTTNSYALRRLLVTR